MLYVGRDLKEAIRLATAAYRKPTPDKHLMGGYDDPETDFCGRPIQSRQEQRSGAIADFRHNYRQMLDANHIGADKYFHCVANCQATQRGTHGARMAEILSNSREWLQDLDPRKPNDRQADQRANVDGRNGARANPCGSCDQICASHRPNTLPQHFRAD